jgi:hypothetical protein
MSVTPVEGRQAEPFGFLAEEALKLEKGRVGAEVRIAHLARRGRTDVITEEYLRRARELENWVDNMSLELLREHPVWPWISRIKGAKGEPMIKVLGQIEGFGRFYPVGDPMIPAEVSREPEAYTVFRGTGENRVAEEEQGIWVEGIERLTMPSKLRKLAGIYPGAKREKGKKLAFNDTLRTMMWRLGLNFMRTGNKFGQFYGDYRGRLERRLESEGIKIIPTPKGRFCPFCEEEKLVPKDTFFCPDCGEKLARKEEPEGCKFKGHVDLMSRRRMMQLFGDLLWVVWRKKLGLSLRDPYPIEYLGHQTIITPEMMVDN